MKIKHITKLFVFTLLISIISYGCSKENSNIQKDYEDICYYVMSRMSEKISECEGETSDFQENNSEYCKQWVIDDEELAQEKYDECLTNIKELSCDNAIQIETTDDFKQLAGCLEGFKKATPPTNEEVCVGNYIAYCSQSFYECGESILYSVCDESKNVYGSTESKEITFNSEIIKNFCMEMNNSSELSDTSNYILNYCPDFRENTDCGNFQELDFRSDNWKDQCTNN